MDKVKFKMGLHVPTPPLPPLINLAWRKTNYTVFPHEFVMTAKVDQR
jgi:hypothetical protein